MTDPRTLPTWLPRRQCPPMPVVLRAIQRAQYLGRCVYLHAAPPGWAMTTRLGEVAWENPVWEIPANENDPHRCNRGG